MNCLTPKDFGLGAFCDLSARYSHLSNNHGRWNKRGGWDFLKKLVKKCNKRGVEGGKNLRNQ